MSGWIIYDKNGLAKCEARKLTYSGEFLGACSVSVNITSPTPIGFELGDWLEYRGERFELNYDPSVVKESSSDTYGEGFQYENIVFNSLADELTRCDFLDYVPKDNELHYSSLPTFSFFADSIAKLAERIQANLDRIYTGDKKWTVEVHPEYVNTLNVNITASNNTVWDALGFVNSKFGANFITRGRKITIGTTGLAVGQLFSYGKGNGLYKIERNAESNQKVITRLRAYGSTRNMPTDYYHNVSGGNVPNNMAVRNLMLPSFPVQTHDPYIDSKNIEELGIREGTVFFDGSSELEEIYPTMEGMTAEDLKKAGVSVNAEGRLDEVVGAEQITDDGKFAPKEGEEQVAVPDFTILLKDVGFDLNDYLGTSSATISMKDGMCGGRDFEIVKCEKEGDGYKLTCHRHYDESLDLYFPYNSYQIKGGDKFVLLNIEMPDVYIKAASQRLLNAATAYLAKNDYVRYSYTLSVDNIFMARQHDEASINNETSIHDVIKEGDLMLFEDEDLGINGSITISSLSIKENADESIIPEYEITLQDEKTVGTIEKIQNQITNIISFGGGSETSINTEQVKSIIQAVGAKLFLSKTKDDKTPFNLGVGKNLSVGEDLEVKGSASIGGEMKSDDFVAGDLMGSGWSIYRDSNGNTVVEADRIVTRKSIEATELVVNQETFEKGSNIFVKGGCTITKVEIANGRYRCYYDNEEGRRFSGFKVGDQARCQRYNASYGGVIKYYWRLVTGVEEDYVELSMTDCDGTGIPEEGDDIAQLGSRYDKTRQSAIVISPDNGGSVIIWAGIDSFDLSEKNMVGMGVNPNTGRAYLYGYGDMFFGDRSLEKNYITYQTRDGETEPTLNINADIHFGKGSDGLSNLSEFKDIQNDVDNLFGQIEREFTIWYYDYEPTLDNEPAVNWVTDSDKALHDQDIFFSDKLARAWRFVNGAWVEITDERTLSALKLAEDAHAAAAEAEKNAREAKEYIDNILPSKLEELQNQIDGAIESFFYKYDPTTSNEPASFWITEEQKAMHLNDTFTNLESGYSWRWTKNGSVYGWTEISDTATVKALVAAGQAQDTADQKRRVFVKTPYTPYDEGDLWVQGETGDIMRCSKSRASGNFVSSDWGNASKYTDDTKANEAQQKAEDAMSEAEDAKSDAEDAKKNAEEAKEQATAAANRVANVEYLKDTFGKNETIIDGGVYISKLVSVKNEEENIEAFLNGSDVGKDAEHGKLILAGGIPESGGNLEERSRNALTRIYEDGHIVSKSANIEGTITATNGELGGFTIGSKSLENDKADAMVSIGTDTGGKFVRINDPSSTAALNVRHDSNTAIGVYTDGSTGVGVRITAQTGAKAIESYGNCLIRARSSELITINGAAYATDRAFSGTVTSNMDIIITNGNTTLPLASSCKGKVYYVKILGGTLTVKNVYLSNSSSVTTTGTWTDANARIFFSDGTYWYEINGA